MDERIGRALNAVRDLQQLAQLEINVRRQNAFDGEVVAAFRERARVIARELIASRTEIDLNNLTPAEERIVEAVSEYLAIKKRDGKDAGYTIRQLRNRGLIEAAEIAVAKTKPTQGFQTLRDEDLDELSYERIILDHPEEFSPRALWFSRRTLGLANDGDKAPVRRSIPAQIRTEELLEWMKRLAAEVGGLGHFTNADAARALGMTDMHRHGRVLGNIQSRIDFACYRLGLPPLGLTAEAPFSDAWGQQDRSWSYPVLSMQRAAKAFHWNERDFDALIGETASLSGQAHLLWKAELRENEASVRAWAEGLESSPRESGPPVAGEASARRNPDWTREEHVLGLDLYMRLRGTSYPDEHPEVIELSEALRALAKLRGMSGSPTFRNANGVSMKMLNFRRVDPEYTGVGLPSGSKLEEQVWRDYADKPAELASAVRVILEEIEAANGLAKLEPTTTKERLARDEAPYWVFVCNPAKWAIDKFLAGGIDVDTWGVRPSDAENFAPGQLGIVRVGVDRRSLADREGRPPLEPGIYALCEVESTVFPGTGANPSFWADGEGREPGWPTVRVRYLRGYLHRPLAIARLRTERSGLSPLLLDGFQAASFPISASDFHVVLKLLDEDVDELPAPAIPVADTFDRLAELEQKYLNASPEVKTRTSKAIERGPIGAAVKKATGFGCQLCAALGLNPVGFLKSNGDPYVEAHHVMPVSRKEVGSLSASNIMTVCANHHRQLHYGGAVTVEIGPAAFSVSIEGVTVDIPKFKLGVSQITNSEELA